MYWNDSLTSAWRTNRAVRGRFDGDGDEDGDGGVIGVVGKDLLWFVLMMMMIDGILGEDRLDDRTVSVDGDGEMVETALEVVEVRVGRERVEVADFGDQTV